MTNDLFSLTGKHALVTGGTRGIGLEIARAFLQAGADVTIASRKQENVDGATADLDSGDHLMGVAAHVARAEDRDRLIASATNRFGPVDVLVNNAGTNPFYGNVADCPEWAWDKTFDVNLKAPYLLSAQLGKTMVGRKGGSIINIASIAGLQASPNQGVYSVTKAALIMLTKVLARDLGDGKVRCNAILPGLFPTDLSRALWENPELLEPIKGATALGRTGELPELVGAAVYLASDASSFTTGALLQVDGGLVL